jgi:hypothetical protein
MGRPRCVGQPGGQDSGGGIVLVEKGTTFVVTLLAGSCQGKPAVCHLSPSLFPRRRHQACSSCLSCEGWTRPEPMKPGFLRDSASSQDGRERSQNPVRFTPREGSTPSSGTKNQAVTDINLTRFATRRADCAQIVPMALQWHSVQGILELTATAREEHA